ncbi:transglycosylase SLT domain-containing protein [Elioraea sp.]|uniref:lytic transglycosylase domain-containing protein n=1 Tax=Elioraea sp. TaxID=2185103 RepID=UPI003F6FA7AB
MRGLASRLLPLLLLPGIAVAQPLDPGCRAALTAAANGRWGEPARCTQPVAAKTVTWLRLISGPTSAGELARFIAENPDWPLQMTLARRAEEVHAALIDHAAVRRWYAHHPPTGLNGRLRHAEALEATGDRAGATRLRRAVWTDLPGSGTEERAFLERHGSIVRAEDHWARADRLTWARDAEGARRRLDSIPPAGQAVLRARLEALSGSAGDFGFTPEHRRDPVVFFERARALRQQDRDSEAARFWLADGTPAQRAAPVERQGQFWSERHILIRRLIRLRDAPAAYRLAAAHGLTDRGSVDFLEAEFLAGWIALRQLGRPEDALRHFVALEQAATAPISVSRGAYWRGRALLAAQRAEEAQAAYRAAAEHPLTFYGQLGALAAGETEASLRGRIAALSDPEADPEHAALWERRELAQAARLLVEVGEARRARQVLLQLADLAPDAVDRALAARLAVRLGQQDTAVWIARRVMARHGTVLPLAGWPTPFSPPPEVEPALALALMRQESNFETNAVSPAGARGLMQLMPATARGMARELGEPSLATRLFEPFANMRLGTAYLAKRLDDFDRAVPLALAAYNAGAHRVRQWLNTNGDPRVGETDPIDWIELIPFNETRNYVMRVIESQTIYQARAGAGAGHPVLVMGR